jgi:hypothetical protein
MAGADVQHGRQPTCDEEFRAHCASLTRKPCGNRSMFFIGSECHGSTHHKFRCPACLRHEHDTADRRDARAAHLSASAAKTPQPEIHLRPDARAKYGVVAGVLTAAQRNHMRKIGFVNASDFRD